MSIDIKKIIEGLLGEKADVDVPNIKGQYGTRTLYERTETLRQLMQIAMSKGEVIAVADHLMATANLAPAKDRNDAIELARKLQDSTPKTTEREQLLSKVMPCFNRLCDSALAIYDLQQPNDSGAPDIPFSVEQPGIDPKDPLPQASTIPGTTPTVHLTDVSVVLSGSKVLNSVTLDIEPGQIVGVIGPNGSGKSTLLGTMAGIVPVTSGQVGYPILRRMYLKKDAISDQIQLVEQYPNGWPGTVENYLRMYASLHGISQQVNWSPDSYAIHRLGLLREAQKTYRDLSQGYRYRVQLAKVFISYPKLLLLDEPFAALDSATRNVFARYIRDLADSPGWQITVVITAQDSSDIGPLADRILVIDRGSIVSLDSLRQSEGVTFEVAIDMPDREVLNLVASFNGVTVDLSTSPTRLHAISPGAASAAIRALANAGAPIRLVRDITGASTGGRGGQS